MFLTFASQAERREYNGSGFIELQFCRLPATTPLKKIVAVSSIAFWKDDSLYVADEDEFYRAYFQIFSDGVYSNLKRGAVDVYGINYYDRSATEEIISRLSDQKPPDHERLAQWLRKAITYNGFYVLGI